MSHYSITTNLTKPDIQRYKNVTVPLEEQLYELWGAGEGPVRGEEDPAVVLLLAARVQEVIHKKVQGRGLQTPHLAGSVLHKSAAWTLLAEVGGEGDGLPTQRDSINCAILDLLTPFLHWVLGTAEGETMTKGFALFSRFSMPCLLRKNTQVRVKYTDIYLVLLLLTTSGSEVWPWGGKNSRKPPWPNSKHKQVTHQPTATHTDPMWATMTTQYLLILITITSNLQWPHKQLRV